MPTNELLAVLNAHGLGKNPKVQNAMKHNMGEETFLGFVGAEIDRGLKKPAIASRLGLPEMWGGHALFHYTTGTHDFFVLVKTDGTISLHTGVFDPLLGTEFAKKRVCESFGQLPKVYDDFYWNCLDHVFTKEEAEKLAAAAKK